MRNTFRKERSLSALQPFIVLYVARGRTVHTTARRVSQALCLSNCKESNEGGRPYAAGRGLSRSAEGATRLRAVALWHAFVRCLRQVRGPMRYHRHCLLVWQIAIERCEVRSRWRGPCTSSLVGHSCWQPHPCRGVGSGGIAAPIWHGATFRCVQSVPKSKPSLRMDSRTAQISPSTTSLSLTSAEQRPYLHGCKPGDWALFWFRTPWPHQIMGMLTTSPLACKMQAWTAELSLHRHPDVPQAHPS